MPKAIAMTILGKSPSLIFFTLIIDLRLIFAKITILYLTDKDKQEKNYPFINISIGFFTILPKR